MSRKYAMSRVKDALEKSEGNHLKAQRLLLSWLPKDQSLLLGLVEPHLSGIVSHALAHAATPAPASQKAPRGGSAAEAQGEFGPALLQGLKGETGAAFGEPAPRGLSKPGKASQRHIDAINRLAGKSGGTGGKKK